MWGNPLCVIVATPKPYKCRIMYLDIMFPCVSLLCPLQLAQRQQGKQQAKAPKIVSGGGGKGARSGAKR